MTDIIWTNVTVTLGQLQPWERNPKSISKSHAKRLLASWDKFGQFQTVAIGPGFEVYDGHQRLSVLRAAYGDGYQVDARQSSRELTDSERRELVIAAHVGTTGQFNWDELANWDAAELQEWGLDGETLQDWRTGIGALTELIEAAKPEPAEDAGAQIDKADELREKWGVETGQMWRLGEHRIICGDCTDKAVVERVMGGEKADIVFTSPPYNASESLEYNDGVKRFMYLDKSSDKKTSQEYVVFLCDFVKLSIDVLSEKGNLFINLGYNANSESDYIKSIYQFLELGINLRETIVWKKIGMPSGGYHLTRVWEFVFLFTKHNEEYCQNKAKNDRWFNFVEISNIGAQHESHRACFPVELPLTFIERYSPNNSIVYEPFSGSGTTLIACERLGRKCRAVEISPAYCAVAIQRWVDMTGGVPELITDEQ